MIDSIIVFSHKSCSFYSSFYKWFWRRKIHKEFLENYMYFALLKLCSIIELCFNVKVVLFNKIFRLKSNLKVKVLLFNKALMLESSTYLRVLLYSRTSMLELNTYLYIKLVTTKFNWTTRNHYTIWLIYLWQLNFLSFW